MVEHGRERRGRNNIGTTIASILLMMLPLLLVMLSRIGVVCVDHDGISHATWVGVGSTE